MEDDSGDSANRRSGGRHDYMPAGVLEHQLLNSGTEKIRSSWLEYATPPDADLGAVEAALCNYQPILQLPGAFS